MDERLETIRDNAEHAGDLHESSYAHMCRDGHAQIGHSDSSHEQCPLCRAMAALQTIAELPDGDDVSGKMAESMSYTAKAALSSIS